MNISCKSHPHLAISLILFLLFTCLTSPASFAVIVKADTSHETYVLLVLFHSSSFLVFSFLRFASLFVFSSSIVFSPLLLLFSSSIISSFLPFPSLPLYFFLISSSPLYLSLFLSIHLLLSSHLPIFPSSLSKAGDNGGQAYIKVFSPTSSPTAAPVLKPGESYPPTMIPTTSIPTYVISPNTFIHQFFKFD